MTSAVDASNSEASTVTPQGAQLPYRTPTTTPHHEQDAPHHVEDSQRIEIARMQQLLAERD